MTVSIRAISPDFVAEVSGADLAAGVSDEDFAVIDDAFERYAVLIFHDQKIDHQQQIAFSERFGPLEISVRRHRARAVSEDEISDISNVGVDGAPMAVNSEAMSYNIGNQLWHSDSSFKRVPAKASLLHARELPSSGGETEFADLRAAWDALPAERQAGLEGLVAEHSLATSRARTGYNDFSDVERAETPAVLQAVVRRSERTGRKALFLGSHASHVVDMERNEGRALLESLLDFATQPRFVYRHHWQVGDLVMWDNRAVLHRGRPWNYDERRVLRRTTVAGAGPTA